MFGLKRALTWEDLTEHGEVLLGILPGIRVEGVIADGESVFGFVDVVKVEHGRVYAKIDGPPEEIQPDPYAPMKIHVG